ncbi:two-component sensor histidine kinase [Geotalea uraniireducens]|uniref:histidine kinase n=1 Tax=Geotalea uraniireducens TaxID=351604 RepID=A0ABN6VYM3_9BACT|nr:ATP-binding protein [Geotalea uraniireducens]BDV43692.1 two-component sensor histidine kinase [Geotalea uraniireducens]
MKQFRFSLSFLILSSLSFLLILTWILLSLISFKTAEKDLLQQKNERARILLGSFVALMPPSLDKIGESAAGILAQRLAREDEFIGLTVIDRDRLTRYALGQQGAVDRRLLETLQTGAEFSWLPAGGEVLCRSAPVLVNGQVAGAVRLMLSLKGERRLMAQSRHLLLAYFALDFLLLLAVGSFLLSRFIVVPIRRLLGATERISSGDFSSHATVPGGREVANLAESFNRMVDTLRTKQEEVQRYVHSLEQANRQLHEAREEAIHSEKMASIGLLAAGTAHEIGTPLAAIMGYAGLLGDELAADAEKADYVRRIEQDAERIDRIVSDLLNYARPADGVVEECDVNTLVAATVEMLDRQGAFKGIKLALAIDPELPPLQADPHQLQQVLINLLINARDAMPGGGRLDIRTADGTFALQPALLPAGEVSPAVRGRRTGDFGGAFRHSFAGNGEAAPCVWVEIADTGSGIDAAHLGKIFDPFFTTKEPGKGTGLGLAISARIIDSFGGRITVDSVVGRGTRFIVLLPVRISKEEE